MQKNLEMIKKVKKRLRSNKLYLPNNRMLCVEDLAEEQQGQIILASEAQSETHSAVVVQAAEDMDTIVGLRVYYRPYSGWRAALGPDSLQAEALIIHADDIQAYEEVTQ